jgi:hypothetical protein
MAKFFLIICSFLLPSSVLLAQFGPENVIVNGMTYGDNISCVDLDGDGDQDPVVIFNQDNTLSWFENLGEGNLGPQQVLLVDYVSLKEAWTPDLDEDGDPDIMVSGGNPGGVFWLENLGGGAFAPVDTIYMHFEMLTNSCPVDLDGDGDEDVIANFPFSDELVYFENLGGGNFGPYQVMNVGTSLTGSIDSGDMDNDGDQDVVFTVYNSDFIAWQENLGGLNFAPLEVLDTYLINPRDAALGDLDNDGLLDIVAVSKDNGQIGWFKNYGSGNFGPVQLFNAFVSGANAVKLSDFDNDLDLDIVACGYTAPFTIKWIENVDGAYFYPAVLINSYYSAHGLTTADMDNDGDDDVLAASFHGHKASWFENYILSSSQARGRCYVDFDQDGEIDSNDIGMNQFSIVSNPQSSFAYTYSDGRYILNFDSTLTMSYLVQPPNSGYWGLTSDSTSYTVNVDAGFIYVDSLDFGFFPDTLVDTLTVDLVGSFPRCNTIINYWLTINNSGTTIPSGVIELVLADSVGFVNSSVVPDSIVAQKVYWHYDSLLYFSGEQILISVQMPSFMSLGDVMINQASAWVDSLPGQVFSAQLVHNIACAYDPNDKTSLPFTTDASGSIPVETPYLDYIIRFQNTGNDTAISVVIKDQLHPDLNWTSLTPLSSSHNMTLDFDPATGEVSFIFDHIFLPDSNVNEPASHGFVKYRIEIDQGLSHGDEITNTAEIYFDFNPAVITNTVLNTLYSCNDILSSAYADNLACSGDTIYGNATFIPWGLEAEWSVDGNSVSANQTLSWETTASGIYNLVLALTNDYCMADTVISVVVFDEYLNLTSVSICEGDSVLVFGNYLNLSGIYYDSSFTVNGCDSISVIDLNVISCLGVTENDEFMVSVFPNPAKDQFTVECIAKHVPELNLQVWDLAGKLVYSENLVGEPKTIVNTVPWQSGVYVVSITIEESNELIYRSKLIIQ